MLSLPLELFSLLCFLLYTALRPTLGVAFCNMLLYSSVNLTLWFCLSVSLGLLRPGGVCRHLTYCITLYLENFYLLSWNTCKTK
ncbi:hypothetical protein [Phaffia rhodozyma]|uniref:Uncharacterized protein n=1 Tax=Phaffia rhodozyma TaxID=264483 RepID=A0A0F7SJA6_PHARH|nr:hypothetical protein [Phaffia rhodozyma]